MKVKQGTNNFRTPYLKAELFDGRELDKFGGKPEDIIIMLAQKFGIEIVVRK